MEVSLRSDHKIDPKKSVLPVYMQDIEPIVSAVNMYSSEEGAREVVRAAFTVTVITSVGATGAGVIYVKTKTLTYDNGVLEASVESDWVAIDADITP